jgi:hypothetical protein
MEFVQFNSLFAPQFRQLNMHQRGAVAARQSVGYGQKGSGLCPIKKAEEEGLFGNGFGFAYKNSGLLCRNTKSAWVGQ